MATKSVAAKQDDVEREDERRRVARELRKHDVAFNAVRVPFRKGDRPEVEALSGQRHVPLLVIDGEAICDAKRIVEHLDWMRSRSGDLPGCAAWNFTSTACALESLKCR